MHYCPSCTKWKTCEHEIKAHPRDGITHVHYYINECDKYIGIKHLYVYQGYKYCPSPQIGYVLKSYTDEEYEYYSKIFELQNIEPSYDNTDYIHDKFIRYNPKYIHRKPISEGTFWGVPETNMDENTESLNIPQLHKLELKVCKTSNIIPEEVPKLTEEEINDIKKKAVLYNFYNGGLKN